MYPSPHSGRSRLLVLAVLLAGTLSALPPFTYRGHSAAPALLFLSPNTDDGLSLEESLRRLTTPEHTSSRRLAIRILHELAIGPGKVHDALGEWGGGIENSLLVVLPQAPDAVTLRIAAAWFGLVADQKAVLVFRPDPRAADVLTTLVVSKSLAEVRALLDIRDIHDRTILIDPHGCRIFVLDKGDQRAEALAEVARTANGRLTRQRGDGETIAGATREEARQRYREVLRGSRLASAANAGR